jgi:hypothetical protein
MLKEAIKFVAALGLITALGTTAVLAKPKSCSGYHSAERHGGVAKYWCR